MANPLIHNPIENLCAMAREAQGERLNDIRLALNELVQADHAAWAERSTRAD